MSPVRRRLLLFALLAVALTAGCSSEDAASSQQTFTVEKSYAANDLAVTLRLSATEITASDRIVLELEATAPEGEPVVFPEFADNKLGEFQIAASRRSAPRLVDQGRVQVTQTYELEPFLPGDYPIPPIEIKHAADALTTEQIAAKVNSVLPADVPDPDIKDIAPPIDLPGTPPWVYALIAAGVLALAAAAYYFWRRRRKEAEAAIPVIPPHELAFEDLAKLLAEDLIAKGQIKLFYLRLSNILRRYIEGRFGLHAPESTTEEFLEDLRAGTDFSSEQKSLLRRFLLHCDLVKFAKHQPGQDEVDLAVGSCRTFIDETKPMVESPLTAPKS
ncbi:MAG: LPXTG cell wall anchor domain-containing protein [Acidobacteria bacterium]|nr:LPXTG cell wall anchor domain-containing protein [Acidobacteriota bacterium]